MNVVVFLVLDTIDGLRDHPNGVIALCSNSIIDVCAPERGDVDKSID